MGPIRVLIVDDSALARELITSILSMDTQIRVIGEATNGREAIEKTRELKPDIVTMDIEMPVMNGIEAIEHIMATNAVPILVVTTQSDAQTAYTAVSKGALDLLPKPDVHLDSAHEFIRKLKLLSQIKVITHIGGKRALQKSQEPLRPLGLDKNTDRIIAIASSTGGPHALSTILSGLPEKFPCPVVIAQHIPDGFVKGLAEWLGKASNLHLTVAEHGKSLEAGRVYLSPPEQHMEVDSAKRISLIERSPGDIYHPSCDALLSSVARVYGNKSVGVILTGMGNDGASGMKAIQKAGGITIAQDEATSVIFGMNRVAIEGGGISRVLPIGEIGSEVVRILSR
jgi:two-component system, chemotaxis family, protein-glutamate methylesterase/glutaminase